MLLGNCLLTLGYPGYLCNNDWITIIGIFIGISCTGNIGSVLLVTSADNLCNRFDPDQAPHFVGTDLGPKVFQHTTKNMKNYRACSFVKYGRPYCPASQE